MCAATLATVSILLTTEHAQLGAYKQKQHTRTQFHRLTYRSHRLKVVEKKKKILVSPETADWMARKKRKLVVIFSYSLGPPPPGLVIGSHNLPGWQPQSLGSSVQASPIPLPLCSPIREGAFLFSDINMALFLGSCLLLLLLQRLFLPFFSDR